jgi:hypothetical protein
MSGGLAEYTRTLNAAQSQAITVRGVFLRVADCSSEVEISLRQYEVGSKQGTQYTMVMRKGEKIYAASEFDNVTIRNLSASAQTIVLMVGYGDYAAEVPNRIDSADIFRPDPSFGTSTGDPIEIDDAGQTQLAGDNARRKTIFVQLDSTQPDSIYVSATEGIANQQGGLEVVPGQTLTLEYTGAIWARAAAADTFARVMELVYNA